MLGKEKCKLLREIRQKIADENDIPFVTEECTYERDCKGTCPKCEAELHYLEQQLQLRQSLGKRVEVASLRTGLALGSAGCSPVDAPEKLFSGSGRELSDKVFSSSPFPEFDMNGGMVLCPDDPEGETAVKPESAEPEILPWAETDGGEDDVQGFVSAMPEPGEEEW